MKLFFQILFIVFTLKSFSQNQITDSLKKIAVRVDKDSASKIYVKIANIFTGVNSDSVRAYAIIADKFAKPNSLTKGDVLIQFGNSYHMENKIDSALAYYNKALGYFQKINNEKGIGKVYQSFALVKKSKGDIEGAIIDSKKALVAYGKIDWNLGRVNVLNNISNAYASLKKNKESVEYSRQSFSLSKKLNDSLKYYSMMAEYGGKLLNIKLIDSTIYYINKATPFLEKNNQFNLLLVANSNLGEAYFNIFKSPELSLPFFYKCVTYSNLSGAKDNLQVVYRNIAVCYLIAKQTDSAEFYFVKTMNIKDSLANQKGLELTKELQTKYETEKKELQIKNQSLEINAQEKQNKQQQLIIILGALALLSIGFFGAMAFINFKKTQKAKLIIEEKNKLVETQNKQINLQKNIVEEKQKEIIDSINYAKRIQNAVLTGNEVWSKISVEHFILFKPKDIVSGDFYWAYNTPNNRSIFLLADCTGHGVPGGFMSMLGNSFLNEIIVENKIFKADTILNKLRDKIKTALHQDGAIEQKDGMDISLCVWNKLDNTLEFAGANNPMWLVRNNQITEYKADKMPIGSYVTDTIPFTAQAIQLQTGDCIYLITDGYADQFGGIKGKKYKYKPLMDLLLANHTKPMLTQKELFAKTIDDWKQGYEQVDDISLIGVRV